MNWQFPVHITGTRATISMFLKQGKKCNQNRRKLYSVNSFPAMTTGICLWRKVNVNETKASFYFKTEGFCFFQKLKEIQIKILLF